VGWCNEMGVRCLISSSTSTVLLRSVSGMNLGITRLAGNDITLDLSTRAYFWLTLASRSWESITNLIAQYHLKVDYVRKPYAYAETLHKKSAELPWGSWCARGLSRPIQQWCPFTPSVFNQSTTFVVRLLLSNIILKVTDDRSCMILQQVSFLLT